jgi:hypothetical protein
MVISVFDSRALVQTAAFVVDTDLHQVLDPPLLRSQTHAHYLSPCTQHQQDLILWPGFLRPFNSVRILDVYKLETPIAHLLGELIGERTTQVLPMLRTLVLKYDRSEPLVTPILKPFIDARRLLGHPVKVHWEKQENRQGHSGSSSNEWIAFHRPADFGLLYLVFAFIHIV